MDRNECVLIGRIASKIKESKTQSGNPYVWFLLDVENRGNGNTTANNYHQTLNIMCFKKNVIEYMRKVNAHAGCLTIIFGFISSFITDYKGKSIASNAVNANDVYLVKTKTYNNERQD